MSYPVALPNEPDGYDWGYAGYPVNRPAFGYLGNQYAFITQSLDGDKKLHAFKSTDLGLTWGEMDAANAPGGTAIPGFGNFNHGGPQYTVARDGSTVLVLAAEIETLAPGYFAVTQAQLIQFDLGTEMWGTITTFAPGPLDFVYTGNAPFPNAIHPSAVSMRLVVRGAADYVLYHSGVPELIGGLWYGRVYATAFDGVTFGTPDLVPGQAGNAHPFWCAGADTDSNTTEWIFLCTTDTAVSLLCVTRSAGVFNTAAAVTTDLQFWQGNNIRQAATTSEPVIYTPAGGVETIAISTEVNGDLAGTFQNLSVFHAPVSSNASPTWTASVVTTGVDNYSGGTSDEVIFPVPQGSGIIGEGLSLAATNGNLVLAWTITDTADAGSFYYSTSPSNVLSWTSPALIFATGTITGSAGFTQAVKVYAYPADTGLFILGNSKADGRNLETAQFSFLAFAAPLGITCGRPPSGTVGTPYTHTFPATGGTPPYTFATAGALPGGLSLNASTGVVSGTPTTPGAFPFTIQVTDADAATASVPCSITINASVTPPTITCGSPPAGVFAVPYSHDFSLTTSSGTPPYTWAIISGLLPPGLTLDGSTGIVSGTPTTAGFYPFTIQVMDSLMLTGSVDCSITTTIPGIGNLYTLEPTKLTDDDYGRIYPHYVTYFMPSPEVAASAGMASRKMVAYLKSNISGTGIMTVTAYPDNLSNPWPLRCSRTLTPMPRFDLEWSGASCVGDRIAVKFESSPTPDGTGDAATDNEFSLQGLSVWVRGNARLPVRGRAT